MDKADVIVVGGGLAGLGATKALCDHGTFNVTLLEADKIVGGRVKTDYLPDGTPILMGAESFHGRQGNSLLTYARAEKLATSPEIELQNESVLHTYIGARRIPDDVVDCIEEKVWDVIEEVEKRDWSTFEVEVQNNHVGVHSIDLHDFICANLAPTFKESDISASHDPMTILEGILAYEGITEGCKGLHGIDIVSYGAWLYLDDSFDIMFEQNPYHKIVDSLVSKIPSEVIQVEKEVCSIAWDGHDKVIVKCKDGSTFNADHVVYTCSLGVLKHSCSSGLFIPSLPTSKLTAINDIGMSLVNKVFLQFDGPLLPDNKYNQLRLYWTDHDKTDSLVSSNQWVTGLQFIRGVPNASGSFLYHTFFVGEDAQALEALSEGDIGRIISHVLNLFLAQPTPKLLSVKATRWSYPYTRGSYSYTPQGTTMDKREQLSIPLAVDHYPLRILFAGEATSTNQYGCAHSAFDTGIREAKRLLEHYCKNSA